MTFAVPWVAIMILGPAAGALAARWRPAVGRRAALAASGLFLAASAGAAVEFGVRGARVDPLDPGRWLGSPWFAVDDGNAALLVFLAAVMLFIAVVAPMRKWKPGSAERMLLSGSILAGGFASATDIGLLVFWILSPWPLGRELAAFDGKEGCRRSFRVTCAVGSVLLAAGIVALRLSAANAGLRTLGAALVLCAALLRQGVVPFQSWLPHFFSRAPLPAMLVLAVPQWGTWAALRLAVPAAPDVLLAILAALTAVTAVYGAGLALVQSDARRAFGWLFASETAIVLSSLSGTTETGLAGGLLLWLSSGLSLAGLGMTLAALEARRGPLRLDEYGGGYESKPRLAYGFLLLGLCSVGFPGTLGFVGAELLIDGSVAARPELAVAIVVATVLNGLAVVNMYFRLFCGRRRPVNTRLALRPREHIGFMALVVILALLGLWPRGLLDTRVRAAQKRRRPALRLGSRRRLIISTTTPEIPHS
ncbi:MAG: proton-conducting transporter membrane subunit [Deltaproteobacteria bacterium]|nr:proton-conducting transporter membrane subunit [Deltaproteobacteria bacterium]